MIVRYWKVSDFDMDSRQLIHRLLYNALVDIRVEAYERRNNVSFHLADLFHNTPLQLERVLTGEGEGSYDELLEQIKARAAENGCRGWLDKAIENIEAYP